MGQGHVLYVYEDALRLRDQEAGVSSQRAEEIGRSVVKLCLEPDYAMEPEGPSRVTWVPLANHGNALHWVDDPHSTDKVVYLWSTNTLRGVKDLKLQDLEDARSLITTEISSRSS